jgi:hypothetical protein
MRSERADLHGPQPQIETDLRALIRRMSIENPRECFFPAFGDQIGKLR